MPKHQSKLSYKASRKWARNNVVSSMTLSDIFRLNGMHTDFASSIQTQSAIDAAAQYKRLKVLVKDFPAYFYTPEPKKFKCVEGVPAKPDFSKAAQPVGLMLYHYRAYYYLAKNRKLLKPPTSAADEKILEARGKEENKVQPDAQPQVADVQMQEGDQLGFVQDEEAKAILNKIKVISASDAWSLVEAAFNEMAAKFNTKDRNLDSTNFPQPDVAPIRVAYEALKGTQRERAELPELYTQLVKDGVITSDRITRYMDMDFGILTEEERKKAYNAGVLARPQVLKYGDIMTATPQVNAFKNAVAIWEDKVFGTSIQGYLASLPFVASPETLLEVGRFDPTGTTLLTDLRIEGDNVV